MSMSLSGRKSFVSTEPKGASSRMRWRREKSVILSLGICICKRFPILDRCRAQRKPYAAFMVFTLPVRQAPTISPQRDSAQPVEGAQVPNARPKGVALDLQILLEVPQIVERPLVNHLAR